MIGGLSMDEIKDGKVDIDRYRAREGEKINLKKFKTDHIWMSI